MERRYLWDKDNIVSELNSENVRMQTYYRGYNLISDDTNRYYMHNAHGDVVEVFTGKNEGNIYYYNAFGTTSHYENTETPNKWGYCDQLMDFETGNYYIRARYYNPDTGRFISEDPIKDGSNWYAYCGGNPVMFWDPLGLSSKSSNVSKNINVPAFKQNDPNNCWAAALSMVIAYQLENSNDVQNEIVSIVEKEGKIVSAKTINNVNSALGMTAIDVEKYESGTEPIEYTAFPGVKVMENQHVEGGKLRAYIIEQIDKGNPIILLYNCGGNGHFIVVTGYEKNEANNIYIIYNDPWDGKTYKATMEEAKSMLQGVGYNYSEAYGIRDNTERIAD